MAVLGGGNREIMGCLTVVILSCGAACVMVCLLPSVSDLCEEQNMAATTSGRGKAKRRKEMTKAMAVKERIRKESIKTIVSSCVAGSDDSWLNVSQKAA